MIRIKSIVLFLTMQCFLLSSYEPTPDNCYNCKPSSDNHCNNDDKMAYIKIYFDDYQNILPSGRCDIYAVVGKSNRSLLQRPISDVLREFPHSPLTRFFKHVITPAVCIATIKDYYCAIPGYSSSHGLRNFFVHPSQFPYSDAAIIKALNARLESYFTRVEKTLFDRHGLLRESNIQKQQEKLTTIYIDFLKEFYGSDAQDMFKQRTADNPAMQNFARKIKWNNTSTFIFDGKDCFTRPIKLQRRYAGSVNGNVGRMYRALHEGNSEQAYLIGRERVRTVAEGKEEITSVFEKYPKLRQKVEQACLADKVKAEQARIAKEATIKQEASRAQVHYQEQSGAVLFEKHPDLLKDRRDAIRAQFYDPQFYQKLHQLLPEQAQHIDTQYLTPDQKGILFEGGHYQHHLVNETISVVDTVISGDLVGNMQDAVLDLANASLSLNKEGDVLMTSRALDTCWALIDHAQAAAHYAYIIAPLVAQGAADGVRESLHGAVHALCNPLEAAKDVAQSLVVAGYCLGKVAYTIGIGDAAGDILESDPKRYEEMIAQYAIDPEALSAIYEHAKNNISPEDVARVGTKAVVDMMLLHGVTKAVSAVAKECWVELISCMRKAEQSAETALTAENLPLKCGEEISSLLHKMESTQNIGGSGSKAAAAISEIAKDASELIKIFNIAKYDASIGNLEKLERAIEKLKNIEGALTNDGALFKALKWGQKGATSGNLSTARGAMYEVEKALELMEAGEEIVQMGQKFGGKELDIITKTKIIECKNIDWATCIGQRAEKMRSDLGEWKSIAQKKGKIFELHSKNLIPQTWKNLCNKMGIKFVEG